MARFSSRSRYALFATTYATVDRRGRRVLALTPAVIPPLTHLGEHRRREGQRLDHLSHFYHDNASGFWRIAEHNAAILPDALAELPILRIPTRL